MTRDHCSARHIVLASVLGSSMALVLCTGITAASPLTASAVSTPLPATLSPTSLFATPMLLGTLLGMSVAFGLVILSVHFRKR